MAAKPTSANPCCAALQLKYIKLDEKRNALRKCSIMLRDQVDKLEADNCGLKNAYDEERARVDHERDLKEKETALRISLESKVAELEPQLSSLQQAGCPLSQNLDKELMIVQEQYDEVRARVDHERALKEKETALRISLESKVAQLESQLSSLQQAGCPLSQNLDMELMIVQAQYDEERVRVHHERDLKEKEAALRISLESKVTELESQLSSLQQAGCPLSQNTDKELMIVQEQVSEREGIIDGLKQPLDEETRKDNVEKETDKMEWQKALELNEAEKHRANETLPCNNVEAKMIDDSESNKAILLQYKEIAVELDKKFNEERSYANNLLKQLEEEALKVELLQKELQELTSFRESVESELNQLRNLLEVEKSRVDAEQNKAAKLQMTLELVKKKSLESSNLAQSELKKVKESLVLMEKLKSEASKLTLEQSKFEGMTRKYEAEKQKVLRERQRADTEVVKALELKKLVEENEKRVMEEKSNSMRLLQQIEEERRKVGMLQKQVQDLLPSGKHTVERLKLEKKRLKHAKQVTKLEKGRNYVLQRELGKLKQGFVQTVQHLDVLEKTLCGGTQAVGESTKSSDLSDPRSMYLKSLFGTIENGPGVLVSSATCALGYAIPSALYSQQDNNTVSPSGITPKLHPLVGGGIQEISPNSALDSSATSSPDKRRLESQEQVAGSLATSTIVVDGNPDPHIISSKLSGEAGNAHVAALADKDSKTRPDSVIFSHDQKRKLLHEFESLKYMQFESRRLHGELEEKLSKMHSKLNMLTGVQMEDARCLLPGKVAAKHDGSYKRKKISHKSEETFEHSHELATQSKRDKLLAPAVLPPTQDGGSAPAHKKRKVSRKHKGTLEDSHDLVKQTKSHKLLAPAILLPTEDGGSAQACVDHITDQDGLAGFERQIGGNVMKLLELDNELDELLFQAAVENPLSPNLPEVNCEDLSLIGIDLSACVVDDTSHKSLLTGKDNLLFGGFDVETNSIKSKSYDRGSFATDLGIIKHIDMERNKKYNVTIGSEQAGGGKKVLSASVSLSLRTIQTDNNELGLTAENIPLSCILFSCMKDISRISRILFATRRCLRLCYLHSQTDRRLMELLAALAKEDQLTPREKVCVFFSLTMHEFLQLSSNELEVYNDQCSPCSFPVHLCSVLSDVKNRGILAEAFYFSELLCLFEDFVTQRRLFLCGDQDIGVINDLGSRFDVLLEGKKVVLYGKTASTHEVLAGSVIFSSICSAVGQMSTLYAVSFNILQLWPADRQLILYILHGFASVFGGEYFSKSSYCIQMEVVKSMMTVLEKNCEVQGATLCQPDSKTCHLYPACSRCPFAGSLPPLDILSVLVKELWKYASMPMDVLDSSSRFSLSECPPSKDFDSYINIMASVELVSTIMGWSWTTESVLPELQKLLQSSIQGNFYTSLVLLLGRIGRFGVKSCGYEDAGVKRIKQNLSSLLQRISISEHNHVVASALVFTLDRISLHKEGAQNKLDCPTGLSASSIFATKSYSLLSSEQKGLISALKIS